ncbi:MAG: amidase [Betaproteobacteria bacterium]|nr:amidase [Betaproteobacteria bacterium]
MAHDELAFLSAIETARAIRAKQVSPVEVVQAYLARIGRLDKTLCGYITVLGEHALAAARAAERTLMVDADVGPLFGVPMAVKDQFWTKGVPTTNGSRAYRDFVPAQDATVITRLSQAGTILLGKLAMSELALGGTRRPAWGISRNPWDLERTPGESSTGAGVALAAHLCAASVGEDTGGSGRTPAAYCNAVGLRPTYTRVSRHGLMPACWFLDQAAPMTKTVEDCAFVLGAIAGYDPKDPSTSRRPVPAYAARLGQSIRGIRVGLIRELHGHPDVHPEVKQAIETAGETLRALGAEVREISIPLIVQAGAIYVAIGDTEGAGACDELLRDRPGDLDPASRTRLQAASLVPFKVYNRAMKARVLLRRQFMEAFGQVDVLMSPTSPYPAPKHAALTAPFAGTDDVRARFFFRRSYTGSYALAALPAISVPCGFTTDRLPIGLQIGARPFAEETLLQVAHAYEQATRWYTHRAPAATAS